MYLERKNISECVGKCKLWKLKIVLQFWKGLIKCRSEIMVWIIKWIVNDQLKSVERAHVKCKVYLIIEIEK